MAQTIALSQKQLSELLLQVATVRPVMMLITTDGYCDVLRVRRDHAYLLPRGHSLPFSPRGPVFRIE